MALQPKACCACPLDAHSRQSGVQSPCRPPKKICSGEMEMFFQCLKYDHSERVPISAKFWHGPAHVRHYQ